MTQLGNVVRRYGFTTRGRRKHCTISEGRDVINGQPHVALRSACWRPVRRLYGEHR